MNRWYIIGAIAVVLLLAGGAGYWFYSQNAKVAFFAQALKDARVSTQVSLGGETYIVDNGVVTKSGATVGGLGALPALQLAYALTATERRPLLNLDGNSPTTVRTALSSLEKTVQPIGVTLKAMSPSYDQSLTNSLYPIEYIRKAITAEEARVKFLTERSAESLVAYEDALDSALAEGKLSLEQYKGAATSIAQSNNGSSFRTIAGTISKDSWITSIDALIGDYEGTRMGAQERKLCFSGTISACGRDRDIAMPTLSEKFFAAESPSAGEISLANEIVDLYHGSVADAPALRNGPIYELSSDACTPSGTNAPALFGLQPQALLGDDNRFPYMVYLGDVLLYPTARYSEDSPFRQYLEERGITSTILASTHHYICPTNAADLATILALGEIRETALNAPMSAYAIGEDKRALEALEGALTSGRVVREKDARDYLAKGLEIYASGYDMPKEAISKLISLTNHYEYKTLGLTNFLWDIVTINLRNLYMSKNLPSLTQNTFDPGFFFMFQGGFYALHFGYNGSIAGSGVSPITRTGEETLNMVLYSELPAAGITKTSLKNDMRFFSSILTDALGALRPTQ